MLHPQNQVPSTLLPNEKGLAAQIPINSNFTSNPTPVQAPIRSEFQPVPAPNSLHQNNQPVFTGQDVDLRSLDPRTNADPRLSRMTDQDMRQMSNTALPNPLPPPVGEKYVYGI